MRLRFVVAWATVLLGPTSGPEAPLRSKASVMGRLWVGIAPDTVTQILNGISRTSVTFPVGAISAQCPRVRYTDTAHLWRTPRAHFGSADFARHGLSPGQDGAQARRSFGGHRNQYIFKVWRHPRAQAHVFMASPGPVKNAMPRPDTMPEGRKGVTRTIRARSDQNQTRENNKRDRRTRCPENTRATRPGGLGVYAEAGSGPRLHSAFERGMEAQPACCWEGASGAYPMARYGNSNLVFRAAAANLLLK